MPDLIRFVHGRILTWVWTRHLRQVGARVYFSPGAKIEGGSHIEIGSNFYAGSAIWISAIDQYLGQNFTPHIKIGDNVICSDYVHIAATTSVTIGDGVLMGSRVHITDHGHGTYDSELQSDPAQQPNLRCLGSGRNVTIGSNVWLGDSVVVLPGVSIGSGSIVGANSVVTKSLPSNVIAVGVPAAIIKRFDDVRREWVRVLEDQGI